MKASPSCAHPKSDLLVEVQLLHVQANQSRERVYGGPSFEPGLLLNVLELAAIEALA